MKVQTIATIGAFGLVMALMIAAFIQLQAIILSSLCLVLLAGGWLMGPRGRRFTRVTLQPSLDAEHAGREQQMRILGREIRSVGQPVDLDFRLSTRNIVPLVAVAAVCTASLYVGLIRIGAFTSLDIDRDSRAVAFWILGYACYVLLIPAARWFQERLLLRSAILTLGEVLGHHRARFGGTEISYQFRTNEDRAGCMGRNFGTVEPSDNAVPVLFSPRAPDFSIPACGFWFHKIELMSAGGNVGRTAASSA